MNITKHSSLFISVLIAILIIILSFFTGSNLMNGIQSGKTFAFLYAMLGFMGLMAILFPFINVSFKFTIIDFLLLVLVLWITMNKYLFHDIHCLSLKYFEMLGLVVLYFALRLFAQQHTLLLLLAVCISGAAQAVYGNLQLWGHYPSHHGLFKMTGSFFNPGPYAGYLLGILPIAVGLYFAYGKDKFDASRLKAKLFDGFARLKLSRLGYQILTPSSLSTKSKANSKGTTPNSKSSNARSASNSIAIEQANPLNLIIKYISLFTIIAIAMVLPAARSRAAWLGAMVGVGYLAWHKYRIGGYLKRRSHQTFKLFKQAYKIRNWIIYTLVAIVITAGSVSLYLYKKDSANGRLLIWKVTTDIIKDYPLFGVGQDMFQTHYMEYQAEYFKNNPDSKYASLADDNNYVFNEFLKVWVENGIISLLVLSFIFALLLAGRGDSTFQVTGFKLPQVEVKPKTWNLKPETPNGEAIKHEVSNNRTILISSILAMIVFSCFAYPSEILPIKIVAITCLGLLTSYLALNTSNTSEASIEREQSEHQTAQRSEASNSVAKLVTCNPSKILPFGISGGNPGTWKLNRRSTMRSVVKPVITIFALSLVLFAYTRTNELKLAYITWNNAYQLYNYKLYAECLEAYEKALPVLQHNGNFLTNYGKALSIAEKHPEALEILNRARAYQSNSVLYTALGDSHKALEEYESAEKHYLQAADMAPGKFYPLYLLAKLYNASGQQHNAIAMANTILRKEVKVHSTAIEEIKEEMETIISK